MLLCYIKLYKYKVIYKVLWSYIKCGSYYEASCGLVITRKALYILYIYIYIYIYIQIKSDKKINHNDDIWWYHLSLTHTNIKKYWLIWKLVNKIDSPYNYTLMNKWKWLVMFNYDNNCKHSVSLTLRKWDKWAFLESCFTQLVCHGSSKNQFSPGIVSWISNISGYGNRL